MRGVSATVACAVIYGEGVTIAAITTQTMVHASSHFLVRTGFTLGRFLSDQLSRRTAAGWILAARVAGSRPAARPTATRTTTAPRSVIGSCGSIP